MRRTAAITAFVGVGLAAIAVAVIVLIGRPWGGASGEPSGPRAVIVDQLSLTAPDQAFVDDATSLLETAGYAVDYVPGKQVSVDFYRQLPSHHYALILLRVHAGRHTNLAGKETDDAHLFTSEPYSKKKYVYDQLAGRLKGVAYNKTTAARGEVYFGIPALFVTESMQGNLGGAGIVLMGCDGLRGQKVAQAFVQKGAGAVVGWDDLVGADHTDAATLALLRHYLDDHMSLQDAAAAARTDVGPDSSSGAELRSYPSSN
jgi:hypothetical protein